MRLRAGVVSDRGLVRRANEDSFFLRQGLYAVSDGMGGAQAGEVASQMACLGLLALDPATASKVELRTAVLNANRAIVSRALSQGDLLGMGTTLTAALVKQGTATLAHVGDSRAYLYHDGSLIQLTDDHSWVGEMVRRGELTPDQAATHPHRSVITRALGTDLDLEPDIVEVDVGAGDRLLLCSDGLSGFVEEDEMARILGLQEPPEETAALLVKAALEAGGDDNVTAIVVDVLALDGEGEGVDPHDQVGDRILIGPADREHSAFAQLPRRRGAGVRQRLGFKTGPGVRPTLSPKEDHAAEPSAQTDAEAAQGAKPQSQEEAVQAVEVPEPSTPPTEPNKRRWLRGRWIATLAVVAVLLVAFVGFAIFNSTVYYVGEYEGIVALYRGLPAAVAGIELSSPVELGSVAYDSLAPYLKQRVDAHDLVGKREGQEFLRTLSALDAKQ